ncbi:formate dehydrogenase accessory sulfurtransferase FdhD [Thermoplasma sp.]|uniref:formate dehydrogenase accessory sulfurtransferase FdhD n=1 Tax=Thermoplasma sp. TaxID=1973142 RepID=UPI001285E8E7|nr:formate dehydrogenase accessory sulfurtransferase FdhD [Thermoplasma sp.]KAA8922440.1 MAG: formate dehydrogenase accessory sulfurtransferase FdhD [Thermoplasma sp.]
MKMEVNEGAFGSSRTGVVSYRRSVGFIASSDSLAVEEPLAIDVVGPDLKVERVGAIMRTPVMDRYLVAGFLYSEGFISGASDIKSIDGIGEDGISHHNHATVAIRNSIGFRVNSRLVNSACGVCGRSTIADLLIRHRRIETDARIDAKTILDLPSEMNRLQNLFLITGGVHAAALFDLDGDIREVCEDIGRHNAVDKIIGYTLMEHENTENRVIMVSGRAGFEIVEKAFIAGFPIVVSVSAPSSLAVQVAESVGITLVCFVRENRFTVYSHPDRVIP